MLLLYISIEVRRTQVPIAALPLGANCRLGARVAIVAPRGYLHFLDSGMSGYLRRRFHGLVACEAGLTATRLPGRVGPLEATPGLLLDVYGPPSQPP